MADASYDDLEENQIYPYPGRTKSSVWRFFGFKKTKQGPPSKDTLDMTTVICKLCKKTYANKGNTTNLQQHLTSTHRKDQEQPSTSNSSKSSVPHKAPASKLVQLKINQPAPVKGYGPEKKKELDDKALRLLVGKVLPLSLVSNSHFKEFVHALDPRYNPPNKNEIKKLAERKRVEMRHRLREELPTPDGTIALTHDGWTSCATESYDTVTAHFINSEWVLRSAVLQTSKVHGSHTAENIAARLQDVVSHWKIPNSPTVVTDNAANEKKAIQLLGWERFGCYGHRINLVVKNALEVPEIARILGKTRKLVTLFHQSTSLNDCLLEKQRLVYSDNSTQIGLKLIQDVSTRWNSSLAMLERVSSQSAAIFATASDDKLSKSISTSVKNCCLSFEEQLTVEELIKILSPFQKATTILCAENSPTMSKVILCMEKIHKYLEFESQNSAIQKVIDRMKSELSKRTEYEEIPIMAAVLNPDLKSLSFMSVEDRAAAHQSLLRKALELVDVNGNVIVRDVKVKSEKVESIEVIEPLPELPSVPETLSDSVSVPELLSEPKLPSVSESELNEPAPKKFKCSDLEEWFDDVCVTGESMESVSSMIELEVSRYLSSNKSAVDYKLSLLEWWKKNEYVYPRLSILAKKYLAIPASSVPSERVFSLAGNIVNKKRSRLNPDMVDSLIFMKMNMKQYW